MGDVLRELDRQISWLGKGSTIIHIGAGECRELDYYLVSRPERIVLVEPHPETYMELKKKTRTNSRIELLPNAVVGIERPRAFLNMLNLLERSSLHLPSPALGKLYPGLKWVEEYPVRTLLLKELLTRLDLNSNTENVLVLDTPGEEAFVLANLPADIGLLFQTLIVYDTSAYYHGSMSTVRELSKLRSLGFIHKALVTDEIGQACHFMRFDPLMEKYEYLIPEQSQFDAELAAANALKRDVEAEINKFRAEIKELKAQADTAAAQHQTTLSEAKQLKAQLDSVREQKKSLESKLKALEPYKALNNLDRLMEDYIGFDNGYFIEIGANDGIAQSNTYYFEKSRGWRGLLVEPILHKFLECRSNRSPNSTVSCCACVSFDYGKEYVRLHYSNLMTTPTNLESDIQDPLAHARSGERFLPATHNSVPIVALARTLTSLLDEAKAPAVIDFFSLDVEGAELEVLKGIDFSRYQFRYILVESRDRPRIETYLATKGLTFVASLSHHDYLFGDRSIPDRMHGPEQPP